MLAGLKLSSPRQVLRIVTTFKLELSNITRDNLLLLLHFQNYKQDEKSPRGYAKGLLELRYLGLRSHATRSKSNNSSLNFKASNELLVASFLWSPPRDGQEERIPFTENVKKKLVSTHVQKGGMGVHAHPSPLLPFQSHIWGGTIKNVEIEIYRKRSKAPSG